MFTSYQRSYYIGKDGGFYVCGLLTDNRSVLSPERVQLPPGMGTPITVAVDLVNTFILDDNGTLWRQGRYSPFSERHGVAFIRSLPRMILEYFSSSFVPYTGFPEGIKFLSKSSKTCSIAVITEGGEVWIAGKKLIPTTRIQCPGDLPVVRITTHYGCFVMEDTDGNLYGWGNNMCGKLGLGDRKPREIPTLIQKPEEMGDIVDLQSGYYDTFILDEEGAVWTCGGNGNGQLGREGDPTVLMKVEGLPPLVSIDVGDGHTLGIDEEGNVWGWGNNDFNQVYPEIEGYNRPENSKNTGITDASRVFVGKFHSFVETNSGEVFGFGDNGEGQLGLGNRIFLKSLRKAPISPAPEKKRYVKKPLM